MGREFDRAFVVSDLHLGGKRGFQMFSSGSRFRALCYGISGDTSESNRTLLLINGDFVDFLAEPNAFYWNGDNAETYLADIAKRDAFKGVFEGLREFVKKRGAHLVIVLGNHDLELALTNVKDRFVDLVTAGNSSLASRVEFAFEGSGYCFEAAGVDALATHGNEVDEFNFTRFDVLQQIIRELNVGGHSDTAQSWKPSAGTAFVIDAVNKVKRDFPFVDLLKPEKLMAAALITLSPKNLSIADNFAVMVAKAKFNEAARPDSERRFLDFDPDGPFRVNQRGTAIEMMADAYVNNPDLDVNDLIYTADEGTLGITDWVESARNAVAELADRGVQVVYHARDRMAESAKNAHAAVLRKTLAGLVSDEAPQVRTTGRSDDDLLKIVENEYDVVFTGHTHARRFCAIEKDNVGWLVNTGTWAGLMHIGEADLHNATHFRRIYDLLMSGNRDMLVGSDLYSNECPVAVLEKKGDAPTLSLKRVDENGKMQPQDLSGREYETTI